MSEVLLGLTYDDFIKSVLLPQGEWAQFYDNPPQIEQRH